MAIKFLAIACLAYIRHLLLQQSLFKSRLTVSSPDTTNFKRMYRHCSAASSAVHVVIKRNTAVRALLLQLLVLHLHIACSQQAPSNASTVVDDGWKLGRATYYGAPESFSATFDPIRGKGSFGVLAYGSCGFTDTSGNVPFPKDQVAAAADGNPDYPGICVQIYLLAQNAQLVLLTRSGGWPFCMQREQPHRPPVGWSVAATQGGSLACVACVAVPDFLYWLQEGLCPAACNGCKKGC